MNIFTKSLKKITLLLLFLTSLFQLKAQPGIIGDGFSTGWNNPADIVRLSPSFGRSYMAILNPKIVGDPKFRMVNGVIEMSPSTTCVTEQDKVVNNADVAILTAGFSNCTNSNWNIKSLNLADNFVFKTSSSIGDSFFVARIAGTIRTITSVSHSPTNVLVGQDVTITANLSAAFTTGQVAYLRYSKDNFTTSNIIAMTDVGSVCTATIPASFNSLGTIQYYIFTSGKGVPTSDASKADFFAININNNDGNYYSYNIGGGTTYTWNVAGNGSWATASNWTPTRTTPNASDILLFNNGTSNTITNVPSQTIGSLQVLDNTFVNLQSADSSYLTVNNGIIGADLVVSSRSQLNINSSKKLLIGLELNATGSISGSMAFSNAAHSINAATAAALTFNSGSSLIQDTGFTGDIFTDKGTRNIVSFLSSSQFIQKVGGHPFGFSQPNSKVSFQTGNWYRFQAINNATDPSLSGRTLGNLEFNPPVNSKARTSTGTTGFTLDSLSVLSDTLNINVSGSSTIRGNIIVESGAVLTFTPSAAGTFILTNTTPQSILNSGTFVIGPNANVVIPASSTINLNSNIVVNGKLTVIGTLNMNNAVISGTGTVELRSGSSLSTNHTGGITGSITTSSRSFQNDVNYIYTGSNNQTEGTLPNNAQL
jgi:hypothetical protein